MQIQEAIRFKNRFRILYNGKILSINSITNAKGYTQFVQGFDTLEECIATRRWYAMIRNVHEEDMEIESYSENQRHLVPGFSKEVNDELKRRKTFSGRGLRFKNWEKPTDNKYNPGKYYGPETQFAQSAERSKGLSVIAKIKPKRQKNDPGAWGRIKNLRNDGAMTLGYSLIDSLRKRNLSKNALRKYLRSHGYSVRQSIDLSRKVFDNQ